MMRLTIYHILVTISLARTTSQTDSLNAKLIADLRSQLNVLKKQVEINEERAESERRQRRRLSHNKFVKHKNQRRRLDAVDFSEFNGVDIQTENAAISFGMDKDVYLARTGTAELTIQGDVDAMGSFNVEGDLTVAGKSINFCKPFPTSCSDPNDSYQMDQCCDTKGWQIAYQLDIEDEANYDTYSNIPYYIDNSADIGIDSFSRIAYHLQLDDEYVFVTMNSFTNNATLTGLPIDWDVDEKYVTGISIATNNAELADYNGVYNMQGSVEFWSNCYGTNANNGASSDHFDNDDSISSSEDCYGSFQIHAANGDNIFSYNGWSSGSSNDIGIGSNTGTHPDWTFADNADGYSVKILTVLVSDSLVNFEAQTCSFDNDINAACGDANAEFEMLNCCDGGGWELVYQLDIEDEANYDVYGDIPYGVDRSDYVDDGSFWRVGYHLQLDDDWVFVSMNAYTKNASQIGLPIDWQYDFTEIYGVHLLSNAQQLLNYTGRTQDVAGLEFWSNCYGKSNDGIYSHDDTISTDDCYGSFQVHAEDDSTIFAYNGWSHSNKNDLGIGSYTGSENTDWTFADNADEYDVKRLSVFIVRY